MLATGSLVHVGTGSLSVTHLVWYEYDQAIDDDIQTTKKRKKFSDYENKKLQEKFNYEDSEDGDSDGQTPVLRN